MDKLLVYESMKEVLNDSTEWGDSCKEGGYYEFVSGVIYMVNELIKKLDEKNKETQECLDLEKSYPSDLNQDVTNTINDLYPSAIACEYNNNVRSKKLIELC